MMVLRPGQHDRLYPPSRRSSGPAYITSGADQQPSLISPAPALLSSVVSIGSGGVVPLLLVAREYGGTQNVYRGAQSVLRCIPLCPVVLWLHM
jgi:hypothetical protein